MQPETELLSFTAPAAGTWWAQYHRTILVTMLWTHGQGAKVMQVLPVPKAALVMMERAGCPYYDEMQPAWREAVDHFHQEHIRTCLDRVSAKMKNRQDLLTAQTQEIQ